MARLVLFGIPVSPGISIGKVSRMRRPVPATLGASVPPGEIEAETVRLHEAVHAAEEDLARARDMVPRDLPEYKEIIASHMLICRDPKLLQDAEAHIRENGMSAARALEKSSEMLCAAFTAMDDPYLRDRAQDIRTVIGRIQSRLYGIGHMPAGREAPAILLAEEISPADAMELTPARILSLVTVRGGQTTHTAILARSLHIPALVGVSGILDEARDGEIAVVDAFRGCIHLEPDEAELASFTRRSEEYEAWREQVRRGAHLPAETLDAVRFTVSANIEGKKECGLLSQSGAEGIGLCRTEYTYLKGRSLPQEADLYEEYSAILESQAPARVIFRTLDLGADKMPTGRRRLQEANPNLGLRAIRWCLRHQDIFRTQLRALLRAGVRGNSALMLPMISGLQEMKAGKRIIHEVAAELRAEGLEHDPYLPVGVMIEVPSSVMIADVLAKEADFFSIGTNDLIHYLLAIDRGNTQVAYLHNPLHPAVLRSLKRVIDCAHREGISVGVCGELAADPYCLPILLGMGVDSFSAAPQFVPIIKHLIRNLNAEDCAELARRVLLTTDTATASRMVTEALFVHLREEADFHTTMIRD